MIFKRKKSEKLLLDEIVKTGHLLQKSQRNFQIGQLIALIRKQLNMSQHLLASRAKVSQAMLSRIESGGHNPTLATLQQILEAMKCDLLITALPQEGIETIRKNQALKKAERKISYLRGTMSLEDQEPTPDLLQELVDEEVERLLRGSSSELWDEER